MLLLFLTASFSCLTVVSLRQLGEMRAERGFDGNSGGWFNAVAKWIWLVCSLSLHTSRYVREGRAPFFFKMKLYKLKTVWNRLKFLDPCFTLVSLSTIRNDWMLKKLHVWVNVLVPFQVGWFGCFAALSHLKPLWRTYEGFFSTCSELQY